MGYKLVVSIVPHGSGELITDTAKQAGAAGGTIAMGRGTASNGVLQLLGLGDTSKDIVFIVLENGKYPDVKNAVTTACEQKKNFGVFFALTVGDFCKAGCDGKSGAGKSADDGKDGGTESEGEKSMTYQMINVIVNKGYAEDAMAAARKAGAGGGTIIGARGTAKEGDAAFFGMKIVPEKEMLIILVPSDKKCDVLGAIRELPCFAEAGSGIIFCNEAEDFTVLGKK